MTGSIPTPSAATISGTHPAPVNPVHAWAAAHGVILSDEPGQLLERMLRVYPTVRQLVEKYPALAYFLRDVTGPLQYAGLFDADSGGFPPGLKERDAIGVILDTWHALVVLHDNLAYLERLLPPTLGARRANLTQAWTDLLGSAGFPAVGPGVMAWLAAAPMFRQPECGIDVYRRPDPRQVARGILELGPALTPDLVRKLTRPAHWTLFHAALLQLGGLAALAVARHPNAAVKVVLAAEVRGQVGTPSERRQRLAELRRQAFALPVTAEARPHGYSEETLRQVLRDLRDARAANAEAFTRVDSFVGYAEVSDSWHRARRERNREHVLKDAWNRFVRFPAPAIPGYHDESVSLTPLTDNVQLAVEGAIMQHCVGDYTNYCTNGTSVIYSVRNGRGERLGTLETDGKTGIKQFRGERNRFLADDMVAHTRKLLEALLGERARAQQVIDAYHQVAARLAQHGPDTPLDDLRQDSVVLARIEADLASGRTAAEIYADLVAELEEDATPYAELLCARAADYARTDTHANAIGQVRRQAQPGQPLLGGAVSPLRLLAHRLVDDLGAGKTLRDVYAWLERLAPDDAADFAVWLAATAQKTAKTDAQRAAVAAFVAAHSDIGAVLAAPTDPVHAARLGQWTYLEERTQPLRVRAAAGVPPVTPAVVRVAAAAALEVVRRRMLADRPVPVPAGLLDEVLATQRTEGQGRTATR